MHKSARGRGALLPVFLLAFIVLSTAAAMPAAAETVIIYPLDNSAVNESEITMIGAVTGPGEIPVMQVNGGKVIPFVKPNGTFEQLIKLRPGLNELKFRDMSLTVLRVDSGRVPADYTRYGSHEALEDGCGTCHELGSRGDFSLSEEDPDLCLGCHDDPSEGALVMHDAMEEGCTACHDPHLSGYGSLLVDEPMQLCYQCHDEVQPEGKGINGHSPISDDEDCLACHLPHGGAVSSLLYDEPPGLCYECHDDVLAEAGEKGTMHPPAEEGSCTDCHNPHGGPSAILVAREICLECHDAFRAPGGGSIHSPAADGECAGCHNPHSSPRKSLLRASGTGLCYMCHDEYEGKVVHSPIADDESCLDCHNPHVADSRYLLDNTGMEVCLDCHDNPVGETMVSTRAGVHSPIADDRECTPCHSPHAGQSSLLWQEEPDLCFQCHDDFTLNKKGEELEYIHGPVAMGACSACHRPHASKDKYLMDAHGLDVCIDCHDDPTLSSGDKLWIYDHPPVEEDCMNCHNAHASAYPAQLSDAIYDLCSGCHPDHRRHSLDASRAIQRKSSVVRLPPFFPLTWNDQLVCTGCHVPHGSDNVLILKTEKMVLCMNCH
jgi:predicted CXXCH cytochrome family protein